MRISLLVTVAVAIMILSLIPDPLFSLQWMRGADKAHHWIAYSVLGFIVFLTISVEDRRRFLFLMLSILASTLYGGFVELLQFLTGRSPDTVDFFVNMFGAAAGSIAALGIVETLLDSRSRRLPSDPRDSIG